MAIIGYKKVGWSKDTNKRKYELLVQFDTELEQDSFEKIIDKIQELTDLEKIEQDALTEMLKLKVQLPKKKGHICDHTCCCGCTKKEDDAYNQALDDVAKLNEGRI